MIRILIVEDDALQALALEHHLEGRGYEVVGTARSARQAIQLAKCLHPDLVLMDINLRRAGDGIEAAVELKSTLGIPHVFISAYSDRKLIERAQSTDPLGYITKPYTPEEVECALARLVPQLQARRHR
ncbi:response regulator [Rhodospirillaceae bacterium SYSU D60014]|uniref:response regulator n=1 Tax=Virgifigura deserti TaxID=2268457 RepID=UPI0013C46116